MSVIVMSDKHLCYAVLHNKNNLVGLNNIL